MSYSLIAEERNGQGIFLMEKEGQRAAKVRFRKEGGDTVVIEHTEVMPEHRGSDAGRTVVKKIMEHAKAENLKLKSECSYFSHQLDKL